MFLPFSFKNSPSFSRRGWGWLLRYLQYCQKCLLRHFDFADLLHTLLAFFLFLQELAFAGNIAAVTFRRHVFAKRADTFAGDDLRAYRGLYRHFEHVPRNKLP